MFKLLKQIKKPLIFLFCLSIAISSVLIVSAESTQKFIDDANLVPYYKQNDQISSELEQVTEKTGWDIIIYTNQNGISSENIAWYCDDYYDDMGYGCGKTKSGVMLTVDMNSRQMYILTRGDAMYYFDDSRTDNIADSVQAYLSDDNYYHAFLTFKDMCEEYYDSGKPTGGSYNNVYIDEKRDYPVRYVLKKFTLPSILIGMIVALIMYFGVKSSYKNNGKSNTYNLLSNSNVDLKEQADIFVNKSVSVHVNSSSSGSHHGGGGGGHSSHGGGGRSF